MQLRFQLKIPEFCLVTGQLQVHTRNSENVIGRASVSADLATVTDHLQNFVTNT